MHSSFSFQYEDHKYGRLGKLQTPHGVIYTPDFVFCATSGSIKGLLSHELDHNKLIFGNTFHLRKESKIIAEAGGLHRFMQYAGPIITDSAGFQIFSLGHGSVTGEIKGQKYNKKSLTKVTDDGCYFKCPITGDQEFMRPEDSIQIQIDLGADFIVAFDECTPCHYTYDQTRVATQRSNFWARQSLAYFERYGSLEQQRMYGVLQGGIHEDLRLLSLNNFSELDFFGAAIGGTLGKTQTEMYKVVEFIASRIDRQKPKHLLGIGRIENIFDLVQYGIETFDCVEPTRIARHGMALRKGALTLKIRSSIYAKDFNPIDSSCSCETCKNYSRAYLHHLFKRKEIAVIAALTRHNMHIMSNLMREIRLAIRGDYLPELKRQWSIEMLP